MRLPWPVYAITFLACCWRDDRGDVTKRDLVVDDVVIANARVQSITLHPRACPGTSITMTRDTQGRHPIDDACLRQVVTGAVVPYVRHRERQGCMPGTVYYETLAGCELGAMPTTEKTTGPACPEDVPTRVAP